MKKIFFYTFLICTATAYGANQPEPRISSLKEMVSENIATNPQLLTEAKKLPKLLKKPVLEAEKDNKWIAKIIKNIDTNKSFGIINLTNHPLFWDVYRKTKGMGKNERIADNYMHGASPPILGQWAYKSDYVWKRPKHSLSTNERLLFVIDQKLFEDDVDYANHMDVRSKYIPQNYESLSQYKKDHPDLLAIEIDLGSSNRGWDFVVFRQVGLQIQYKIFKKDEFKKEFGSANESD